MPPFIYLGFLSQETIVVIITIWTMCCYMYVFLSLVLSIGLLSKLKTYPNRKQSYIMMVTFTHDRKIILFQPCTLS